MENPIPIIEGIEKETNFKFSKWCKIIMITCTAIVLILLSVLGAAAAAGKHELVEILFWIIVYVWTVFITATLIDVIRYVKFRFYDNRLIVAEKTVPVEKTMMPRWYAKEKKWKILRLNNEQKIMVKQKEIELKEIRLRDKNNPKNADKQPPNQPN